MEPGARPGRSALLSCRPPISRITAARGYDPPALPSAGTFGKTGRTITSPPRQEVLQDPNDSNSSEPRIDNMHASRLANRRSKMREYSAIGGKEPPFPVTRRNLHCVVLYVRYPPLRAGLALVPVLGGPPRIRGNLCAASTYPAAAPVGDRTRRDDAAANLVAGLVIGRGA